MNIKTKPKKKEKNENVVYNCETLKKMFTHKSPQMIAELMVREIMPSNNLHNSPVAKALMRSLLCEFILAIEAGYPTKFRKIKI